MVPEWQPDGERLVTFVIRNTFLHLEPVPSPRARPAGRSGTAPEALLATALDSGGPRDKGDGDSSWTHSWDGELSDGSTPEGGTLECRGDVDHLAVSDETEMRVTIKNTFLHLEPVQPEFCLRTARRNRTASEVLLAAAFARDAPFSGGEDCAEGPEEEGSPPVTRAPTSSSALSSADSCRMDDLAHASTVGEATSGPLEKKKGKKQKRNIARGLRDASGLRPGKRARERYQALIASLQDRVRQNPSLSLDSLPLPRYVHDNEMLMAKLVARVEAARPAAW
jgi:hypothetical protein